MWNDLDAELESFEAKIGSDDAPSTPSPAVDIAALQKESQAEAPPPKAAPKDNANANELVDDLDALMVSLGKPAAKPAADSAPAAPAPAAAAPPKRDDRRKTMVVSTATSENCAKCGQSIQGEHLLARGKVWHMNCFRCESCSTNITGEFFEAGGKTLCIPCHERDFRCTKCNKPLTGEYFVGDGHMFHPECVDKKFCAKCNGDITTHNINALGKNWHPDCFACTGCGNKLGTSFFSKEEQPYCENCINKSGLKTNVTCNECGRDVTGSYLTFGDKNFHNECLKCYSCKKVLPGDAFYNVNNQPACLECAQKAQAGN